MQISINTPALLFPAITLLMLAYTNRFLALATLIRNLHAKYKTINEEKDIIKAQPDMAGKPAEIVEKMVMGRISKFLKESSLTEQPFVKDPEITVGALAKKAGAEIVSFTRYEVGEGIEKEETDFAAEVAAQVQASKG